MKVTWDTLLREEFDDIQFIIQWRRMGEQKGWRRGESKKQRYIIKNLTPETDYEVKVSALCDKVISPAEQTHVCTGKQGIFPQNLIIIYILLSYCLRLSLQVNVFFFKRSTSGFQ